jgi:hypothetical protein
LLVGSRLLLLVVVGHEEVEVAHHPRAPPLAGVVGHHGQRLAVTDPDGARLRVARRHADDVARLVAGLLPVAVDRGRRAQQPAVLRLIKSIQCSSSVMLLLLLRLFQIFFFIEHAEELRIFLDLY